MTKQKEILTDSTAISSNGVLAEVSTWQGLWTTCRCGKNVMLKENSMGWKVNDCECGTHIRYYNGKMIVEQKH